MAVLASTGKKTVDEPSTKNPEQSAPIQHAIMEKSKTVRGLDFSLLDESQSTTPVPEFKTEKRPPAIKQKRWSRLIY